jgi:hypothetical protein
MTLIYLAEVMIFALAFQLDAGHVEADGAMGLPASGIFALQNLFSASFQSARVSSPYTLGLAATQRIVGILTTAMVTGLFFLRFTQVDSPLRFSRQLCLSVWPDGHLSCRFITADPSYWLEDILQGRTFADLVSEDSRGQRRVDFGALDRTRPIG